MKTLKELEEIRKKTLEIVSTKKDRKGTRIVVGLATCGIAAGARPVLQAIMDEVKRNNLSDVVVSQTGCIGACRLEPIVEVYRPGEGRVTYIKVNPAKAARIVNEHVMQGRVVSECTIGAEETASEHPLKDNIEKGQQYSGASEGSDIKSIDEVGFYKKQVRIALRNCGVIDPENIDEYIAFDGYKALERVLTGMTREQVIETVKASGLRGRGGAGFPTGMKWQFTYDAPGDKKYVLCNADEGDPGAFMDRSVLEGDPHSVIEAMAIAAYAVGSDQGYIYCRAEYPIAVKRLKIAIGQARKYGLLGKNIMETGFNFDMEVRLGAGAFVCGEETALIASIEGQRGMPRVRPPFPAVKGVFGKPTLLNNVETYANICPIIIKGPESLSSMGTEKSKGTKVFALGGKINNTGLVEIPMGTTMREIIYDIGGGCPNGKAFKAAQTGGPSGGCIPAPEVDVEIDYNNLIALGSMMGSGGLIVMDEDNCMVDIARFFLDFTVDESCGKCTPCREGTKKMLEILNRITSGKGEEGDIEKLETLARNIKNTALCGLGQSAPQPVLSTIKYFRDEYEAHIKEKRCPAGVCKPLLKYTIAEDKCKGCGICAKNCPSSSITGKPKAPYTINQENCIKCGTCITKCPFQAITKK